MPQKKKTRRAVLTGTQLHQLFALLQRAVASDSVGRRAIDAAFEDLLHFLDGTLVADGEIRFRKGPTPELTECFFAEPYAIFGLQMALVQSIAGSRERPPQPHVMVRTLLLPIARELGIEGAVRKQANLKDEGEDGLKIEYDEVPVPAPKEGNPT